MQFVGVRSVWKIYPFRNIQTVSGAHPASCLVDVGECFAGGRAAGAVADHLHTVLRLRESGAVPPLLSMPHWRAGRFHEHMSAFSEVTAVHKTGDAGEGSLLKR